eukprot:CAMPEP_0176217110 /NCGR_PEP_ID=MMETSP0121_2-20121125/17531_1 /TAXON_ID=160619 /ORGANISM="Kryptoperidinium foliaceum, Strain CCMP 1326" /LENGTH=130 /DNA_ID=CAMNT_0017556245 /DNA_START=70 /DNA_END=459 /DNA_ORIENTATION=+
MCTPNAEETQHLIECLAKDQRPPAAGRNAELIPPIVAASIREQVGDNSLMDGGELRAIAEATQDNMFSEMWPLFYTSVLLPAAKQGKTSIEIGGSDCARTYFPDAELSMMHRCFKLNGVDMAEQPYHPGW